MPVYIFFSRLQTHGGDLTTSCLPIFPINRRTTEGRRPHQVHLCKSFSTIKTTACVRAARQRIDSTRLPLYPVNRYTRWRNLSLWNDRYLPKDDHSRCASPTSLTVEAHLCKPPARGVSADRKVPWYVAAASERRRSLPLDEPSFSLPLCRYLERAPLISRTAVASSRWRICRINTTSGTALPSTRRRPVSIDWRAHIKESRSGVELHAD